MHILMIASIISSQYPFLFCRINNISEDTQEMTQSRGILRHQKKR